MLDRADATPLYHQLFLQLRDDILSGRRASGDSMPTEIELAEQRGVSRVTARRAMDELSREGLVERRRRTGTRVMFRTPVPPLEANIDQAVESLVAFGRQTAVRIIEIGEAPAQDDVAAALEVDPGSPLVHAERLRSLDGQPLGRISSWMPTGVARHVSLAGLATTPILALLQEAGLAVGSARQTIGASLADGALSELLEVPLRTPILWIERVVRDSRGQPMLFTRASYRADRYRVTLDLGSASYPSAPD